ncbi:hypothetical protein QMK17_17130 [Rhodococcus sp. G-MC3]|uniref:hypothetical protein n=1 Tax=Rhodococcus sp. G-MC3 TaxID=3046209 RepID=UPI0024B907F2|nr:hypothetical protein [Rhodococcus sp. G-MC3]MDJ0395050.1 hypothetical protein [Rhodococcus sp. G-MC3]
MTDRPITLDTLGAWVIKCNPHTTDLAPMVTAGRANEWWCVAENYRSRLMAPEQPVLFWVSSHRLRGLWGAGRLTGVAVPGPRWKVPTDITLFDEPILAARLSAIAELHALEVFRSPQQSNPSWIDRDAWSTVRALMP